MAELQNSKGHFVSFLFLYAILGAMAVGLCRFGRAWGGSKGLSGGMQRKGIRMHSRFQREAEAGMLLIRLEPLAWA